MVKKLADLPTRAPRIAIQCNGDAFSLTNHDLFYQFLPLQHGAKAGVGVYQFPSQERTAISERRIHLISDRQGEALFRVSEMESITDEAELARGGTCDFYFSRRGDKVFTDAILEGAYQDDAEYTQYQDGPELVALTPGITWKGESVCRKHPDDDWELDITSEWWVDSSGFLVEVGGARYQCIKVTQVAHPHRGSPPTKLEAELINESYLVEDGRCVLVRRFNGAVWAKWNKRLWEKLADAPRCRLDGVEFRLWYLMIPAWALAVAT